MRHPRTAATVLSALALTAGLSSCASGTTPAPSGQNPGIAVGEPAPGQADAPQSEQTEQSGQPAEHPGEGTGFGKCTAGTLSVRVEYHGDEDVARSADLFIANVGTKACNLAGFPELRFYDAGHQQLSIPTSQSGSTQELLEIKPGERFKAPLGWSSSPEFEPCLEPETVAVYPPNTSDAKETPWTGGKVCAKGVSIDPYARA
ncbi:DUF4232 domain-containing protein [Saccharopolyspora hirsuta]|uniref:DUF4232 domain-containing protein n=1 Tax=Saccharopolyspora hirsuta TaxID=1837 RepID=UPI0014790CEE|nr:DUF4232 domain-containing protein [Saccharopolyspora hirsuta]